jgi:hypothetical protein
VSEDEGRKCGLPGNKSSGKRSLQYEIHACYYISIDGNLDKLWIPK